MKLQSGCIRFIGQIPIAEFEVRSTSCIPITAVLPLKYIVQLHIGQFMYGVLPNSQVSACFSATSEAKELKILGL